MKKSHFSQRTRFAIMLVAISIFLFQNSSAQTLGGSALAGINNQLRYAFSPLSFQDTNVLHFYDRAGHFTDTSWWVPYNLDTTSLAIWTTVYEELWWTQNDTNLMEGIDEFYQHVNETLPDTVDFALFRRDYYRFVDTTVFNDTTYFHYDSVNINYVDNPNRTSEPYEKERIFMMASLREALHNGSITWKINPDNILIDENNKIDFPLESDGNDQYLLVDFGDGSGYHNINPDSLYYITVDYDSNGTVAARSVVVDGSGDTIDHSTTVIEVYGVTLTGSNAPTVSYTSNGMDIGIWGACDTTGGTALGEKYIILAEGFDFTHDLSPHDMYERYFKTTSLCDLRNHGYNILTISWRIPGDDIDSNAMRLVSLIDDLKCDLSVGDLDTLHQFIVMGESMGGVIARYALDYMEANPNLLQCRKELMHNTRLFVAIDAPLDGANIPMAFQELANNYNFLSDIPASARFRIKNYWDMLDCSAARELLKVHHSTNVTGGNNSASNYGPTQDRIDLENELLAMKPNSDGYPEFCKTMAISKGLLTGEHQIRVDGVEAQPGDFYLQGGGGLFLTVLGQQIVELQNLDLLLGTPDGTTNIFYEYDRGRRFYNMVIPTQQITIGWCPFCIQMIVPNGLPTFELDYIVGTQSQRFSPSCPQWDVMPGGFFSFSSIVNKINNTAIALSGGPIFGILNVFVDTSSINNGTAMAVANELNDMYSAFDLEFESQLTRFNFIPTQSGIDYTIPGQNGPFDDNIFAETTTTIMNRTPVNVVQGEVNGLPGYPQSNFEKLSLARNAYMRFPARNENHLSSNYNHRRNDSLINSDSTYSNPLYAFFLNREIGEEELLLENFTLNRTAMFEAEYIIQAGNQLNPYYDYPNQPATEIFAPFDVNSVENVFNYNLQNNGIYSDENRFEVVNGPLSLNSTAVLKADSIINTTVNLGMTGPHIDLFEEQLVCILDYYCFPDSAGCEEMNNKRGSETKHAEEHQYLSVWPNPALPDAVISVQTNGRYFSSVSLRDIHGRVIHKERLSNAFNIVQVQCQALHLTSGVYFLSLTDGHTGKIETLKIVVQ